jgi:signal transduction histidine kinase
MMSHEINNSVGAINSILQSSLSYGNQLNDDDRKDFEEAIRVAIDRNRGLNTFMANFADVVRIPKPSREECDLHDLLRSVHVLMSSECRRRSISWEWHLSRAPFVVDIDVRQIEQVAVNVIRNALEAISRNGTIVVRTTSSVPRKLMIINNGRGIAPEDRSNLFTPFYSTKRSGQGVGLTLTREILINHGCSFNLETDVCGQTVFWIEFPLARSTSHLATQAEHRAAEW